MKSKLQIIFVTTMFVFLVHVFMLVYCYHINTFNNSSMLLIYVDMRFLFLIRCLLVVWVIFHTSFTVFKKQSEAYVGDLSKLWRKVSFLVMIFIWEPVTLSIVSLTYSRLSLVKVKYMYVSLYYVLLLLLQ